MQTPQPIAQIAAALDYAHSRGVVHGYVHPRHILIGKDESIWLIGFGEFPPPPEDIFCGNPLHLAPEQFEADCRTTLASDVYALTETALWLLCECHPFKGIEISELLEAKRTGRLRREIQEFDPGISPALERVLHRGLAPEPTGRYATAGEFAAALASAAGLCDRSRRGWFWR